jgi:pyruvate ferredoxin oxidoreductase gamma subunit
MYRIRFHGRGGQGMKTASRILGSAFFLEQFEVQDAPRYGAERRGAPIFAYVRAAREVINQRGIIRQPDLVVVADDSLISVPAAGVLAGLREYTVMLINSHEAAEVWKHRLNIAASVLILPAREAPEDRAELPFVGTACAAAAARLVGVISRNALLEAIQLELAPLGARLVERNVATALESYDAVAAHAGCVTEGEEISASDYDKPHWIGLPYDDVDQAAPSVHAAASSNQVKTGSWRTMRPVIDDSLCKRCWWVCSTFCPDAAIKVSEGGKPEIDYDHCKGCLICVAKCPPHAIEAVPEHLAQMKEKQDA